MLANWIKQTTTTTGSGNLTLASVSDYPGFNDVLGVSRRFAYTILTDPGAKPIEAGIGYMSDATTLVRERVTATYASGAYTDESPVAVSLAAGTYQVICSGTADTIVAAAKNVFRNALVATQKIVSSAHQTAHNASSAGYTAVANRLVLVPFKLEVSADMDALAVRVGTGVAATNVRLGIYDIDSAGNPSKLLAETAALASATSGADVFGTVTQLRLQPGWYYVAFVSDGVPAVGRSNVGGELPCFIGPTNGNLMAACGSFYAAHTFGPLPPTAPVTILTPAANSVAVPTVLMRLV